MRAARSSSARRRAALAAAGLLGLLAACNPALNWREVQLGRLTTLLPCKPDSASRPVQLAGQALTLDVVGCEARDTLFAISRVQAADPAQAGALMAALRQATLANMGQSVVRPLANTGDAQSSFDIQVDGQRTDGTPLQARLKWLLAGAEVYQIAAYARQLGSEQTESLITEARIR